MTVAGDESAFAGLTGAPPGELHVHCYRMLACYDEAEDAVHETFLRAWRGRGGFHGSSLFRAWLLPDRRGRVPGHAPEQRAPAGRDALLRRGAVAAAPGRTRCPQPRAASAGRAMVSSGRSSSMSCASPAASSPRLRPLTRGCSRHSARRRHSDAGEIYAHDLLNVAARRDRACRQRQERRRLGPGLPSGLPANVIAPGMFWRESQYLLGAGDGQQGAVQIGRAHV